MNDLEQLITSPSFTIAIVGAQWGDEGKGKIVDFLAQHANVLMRSGGGANAGHTLVVDGIKHVIHLLPSGIIRASTMNLVGPGVVCDPAVLLVELALANRCGAKVLLDPAALIVNPFHKSIDAARETQAGTNAIGTTKRGIGPAYEDLASRRGLRLGDLSSREKIRQALEQGGYWSEKQALAQALNLDGVPSLTEIVDWADGFSHQITPYLGDTRACLARAVSENKRVLCEGAQGAMLDVVHGQPPYTTSSSCTAGGIMAATGINRFDAVIGVAKAYTTRVGAGPFPTELKDSVGDELRRRGQEFGATTGRPRSCGWLDLPALRYACRIGGITNLILTKLDVLADFPGGVNVCTTYADGVVDEFTTLTRSVLAETTPNYARLPSWTEDDLRAADYGRNVRAFISRIEKTVKRPVSALTYGAERKALRFLP